MLRKYFTFADTANFVLSKNVHRAAFTLAEVLITLGIIGVVAAITIPVIVQKYNEKVTVNRVKKVYSVLSQAFKMAVEENGTPDNWGLLSAHNDSLSKLVPYLHIYKQCMSRDNNCFPIVQISSLDGSGNWNYDDFYNTLTGGFILNDGTFVVTYYIHSTDCSQEYGTSTILKNGCGTVSTDINGEKGPNRIGKDIFWFYLTKDGIFPIGSKEDTRHPMSEYCNINEKQGENGIGCTAWVLFKENMDYLYRSDLQW